MEGIKQGYFNVENPFNRQTRKVEVSPDTVHTIVLWSKHIGPFLDQDAHKRLRDQGYHLYFNLTLNPDHPVLEPGIPDLSVRLHQLRKLCKDIDPGQVTWRFDPICVYTEGQTSQSTADHFIPIAKAMGELGIRRCVTSFYDPYKKVERRIDFLSKARAPVIRFIQPDKHTKLSIIRKMAKALSPMGIDLGLCCEKELIQHLGNSENIGANACIDGRLYHRLFGGSPETARDYGQRKGKGCMCTRSVDIGSYDRHPCHHNCLFCYARTGNDVNMQTRHSL